MRSEASDRLTEDRRCKAKRACCGTYFTTPGIACNAETTKTTGSIGVKVPIALKMPQSDISGVRQLSLANAVRKVEFKLLQLITKVGRQSGSASAFFHQPFHNLVVQHPLRPCR